MSATPFNISALVEELYTNARSLSGNDESRQRCLAISRTLSYALETPLESKLRLHYAEPSHQAAIRIGIELNLFQVLDECAESASGNGGKGVSTLELAKRTGAQPLLLARILKHLAAMGTIYETEADLFLRTRFSHALTRTTISDGFQVLHEVVDPPVRKLHEHLSKNRYKNPEDPLKCPFQLAHGTNLHYFQWMAEHPKLQSMFNNHMTGSRERTSSWMDKKHYPLEENLVKGASEKEDAIFFIDIGGGNGHDIKELCRQYPHVDKRMILQDQESVVSKLANSELDSRIQPMAHNFFEEQPIRGARTYYMHRVLHDWPDGESHKILTNVRAAMTPGYSKLLLYDMVIPDRGAQGNSTGLDLIMMSLFAACERTEKGWKELLEGAGFRVESIWPVDKGSESLIECVVA